MQKYILDGKIPVKADLKIYVKWRSAPDYVEKNRVAYTELSKGYLSTVFLTMDHSFDLSEGHTPVLFESMAFDTGTEFDSKSFRYTTWEEAEKGHAELLEKITGIQSEKVINRE
jgi:hypothetical protein